VVTLTAPAPSSGPVASDRASGIGWTLGAGGVVVLGLAARLALGGFGMGERSALVMAVLLSVGAWVTVRLLSSPRTACLVTLAAVALLDVAALPPRSQVEYDDVQAMYRPDQVLSTRVTVGGKAEVLTLLAQAVYAGAQPSFGLSGDVHETNLQWTCPWQRSLRRLALPLPPPLVDAAAGSSASSVEVRLSLNGSPSRESDYLLVYTSSHRGGPLVAFDTLANVSPEATLCALA